MSKIRIYVEPRDLGDSVEIMDKETVHKIKDVLRLKEKEALYVFDGEGKEYLYEIRGIKKKAVILEKKRQERKETASLKEVILGFPVLREEKVDFILQKATELGVTGFLPFISGRSLQIKLSASKIKRWRKIVIEAVRQSGRLWIPKVHEVGGLSEIAKKDYSLKIAASIKGDSPQNILSEGTKDVLIVVGPEGDFAPSEYEELKLSGFEFIKLSPYILRTETAAMFAAGIITQMITDIRLREYTDDHRKRHR